jgi:predicted DNA-binding transcriptional regulator AlpA
MPTTRTRKSRREPPRERPPLIRQNTDLRGAAEFLSIDKSTLIRINQRGEGPPRSRVGRRVVYRFADLDAWLRARQETA